MVMQKVTAAPRIEVPIGVLGCGFTGKVHTNAFKKIPYIYADAGIQPRLMILCDNDERRIEREAARYGYEEFCTNWEELVQDERIGVFDNCAPDPVHVEPCIAALQNGKHVICEKPLALSVRDARRMRDAASTAPGRAMCTFNYRFMPAVRMAKELIANGKLGRIYHIRVNYLQMSGHDPSTSADVVWSSAWPHSGGLQGLGSHAIDQCRFLIGEIKSVSALVHAFHPERARPSAGCPEATSDEATAAILELDNGAIGVFESSVVATGRRNFLSWEINGSKGSLRWDLEHPNSLFACLPGRSGSSLYGFSELSITERDHPHIAAWWPPGHNIGWEHGQIIEKFHFLDAVAHGKIMNPDIATFEDGYRVAVVIDAMRRSSASGQRVDVSY